MKAKEIWKRYKKVYAVSNHGRVYSYYKKRLLSCHVMQGRHVVTLTINGKRTTTFVDKLVCKLFKKNYCTKLFALHKNGISLDDRNSNLKPITLSERFLQLRRKDYVKIGVYKFTPKNTKIKVGYRAVVRIKNRTKTLGYTKTWKEAYNMWKEYVVRNQVFF